MPIAGKFPSSGKEKINNAEVVEVLAADQIRIGDTVYTTVGNDPVLKKEPYYSALSDIVYSAVFSPDGKTLVLSGTFTGYAKVYSVSGSTIRYVSDIYADAGTTPLSSSFSTAVFSPDSKTLILGVDLTGYAKVYSVSGSSITYVSDIYADAGTTALDDSVVYAAFSPDGKTLVLLGMFTGYAKVYSVSGSTIRYVSDIYADAGTTAFSRYVTDTVFSPDGKTLVLLGMFTGRAKVYSVSESTIRYVSDIYADAGTTALDGSVTTAVFSPDGKTLVLSGNFTGRAKAYSVSGSTVRYVSDIYADAGTTAMDVSFIEAAFSPDSKMLVLSGNFTGKAKVYSVSGSTIRYVSDIYADEGTTALSSIVRTAVFSPDGKTLVLGGTFTGCAKVYSVSGSTITYVSDIYADAGTTAMSYNVYAATFSHDGKTLVLGGIRTCKAYSVSGLTIRYVSDIYADAGTTALDDIINSAVFSPDGKTLVLGGTFTGCAKVYSVSGSTIRYVSDIYADAGTTALDVNVATAAFSPDGKTLVLGGGFTGRAKAYSVSGSTITYVSDIYADAGTTALDDSVFYAAFSPDGKTLVLSGNFTGRAKVYSVSGSTIRYVSDIYADAGTTAMDNVTKTAVFSPDGKTLVLGGWFTGCAKAYSVSGSTIRYVSDIYADAGTTAPSSIVRTAAFSPDGKTLVLGGWFTGYGIKYFVDGTNIFIPQARFCYLAVGGKITPSETIHVGFSKENIENGSIGKVKLIAEVTV